MNCCQWCFQTEGYTLIDEERHHTISTKTFVTEWKQQFIGSFKLFDRRYRYKYLLAKMNPLEILTGHSLRDVRVPLMLLLVVIIGQQCSGMKIIQGIL